jgi:eukaryotic-like serine/threonine-protein kinase
VDYTTICRPLASLFRAPASLNVGHVGCSRQSEAMTLSEARIPSIHDLHPALRVSENVRLVRQIGEGGMGSVWLADHLGLDAQVAVKFMSPALAYHPAAVARFIREARAAAHIRHPHVVQIFDSGAQSEAAGGLPYMVMEYLEGEDLEMRLARGRLSLEEAAMIVLQTSRALEKAHGQGVVHRDIKPENIFLCDDNGDDPFVKVLDFGIAKTDGDESSNVTKTGAMLGTPSYMSPEQMLSAKAVDYRCDLWALAVVAYYAVTGKLPFGGETYGAICLAVNRGRFRLPSRLRRSIPESMDAWFQRALARDPKYRFGSARELGEAFVAAVEHVPAGVRRKITPFSARATLMGSSWTRSGMREPRSRLVPFVAVLALAAGALMAVLGARTGWYAGFHHPANGVPSLTLFPPTPVVGTGVLRPGELELGLEPATRAALVVARPVETPAPVATEIANLVHPAQAASRVPRTTPAKQTTAPGRTPVTAKSPYAPESPVIVPLPPAVPASPDPSRSGPGA